MAQLAAQDAGRGWSHKNASTRTSACDHLDVDCKGAQRKDAMVSLCRATDRLAYKESRDIRCGASCKVSLEGNPVHGDGRRQGSGTSSLSRIGEATSQRDSGYRSLAGIRPASKGEERRKQIRDNLTMVGQHLLAVDDFSTAPPEHYACRRNSMMRDDYRADPNTESQASRKPGRSNIMSGSKPEL
jgi:hypothetical protein